MPIYYYSQYPTSAQLPCRPVSPSQHIHSQAVQPAGASHLSVGVYMLLFSILFPHKLQPVVLTASAAALIYWLAFGQWCEWKSKRCVCVSLWVCVRVRLTDCGSRGGGRYTVRDVV